MSGQSESAVAPTGHGHAWIVAGIMLLTLVACTKAPPEQALRDTISNLQVAVEARDASAIASFLADDFIGPDGMDRDDARRMATLYLMRHDSIGTTTGPLTVQMQSDHARVDFTVALTGGSGRLLPESGRAYAVRSGWRIEDGDWKMTSASWEPQL